MTRLGHSLVVGLLASAAVMVPAGPASAIASVAIVSEELLIGGDDAVDDRIHVVLEGTTYRVSDFEGNPVSPGAGCTAETASSVVCPDPGHAVVLLVVHTGGGDDRFQNLTPTAVFADGGPGNDYLSNRPQGGRATIVGGPGNDRLFGEDDGDRLRGGPGNDDLRSGRGWDRVNAGDGRDQVLAGGGNDRIRAADGEVDRVDGGEGRDRASVDPKDRVRAVERVT